MPFSSPRCSVSAAVQFGSASRFGKNVSDIGAAWTFVEVNNVKVPYEIVGRRAGDIATCYADPTKSREILGWTAEKGLSDMCRDSWRWQSQNPMGYGD